MKSEKEKMIAGEPYLAGDAELVALRQNARENMRAFNDEIDPRKRSELLKNWFGKTGQKIYMEPSLSLDYGSNIFVGENFYANFNCTILDTCPVTFGNNVMIAPNVSFYTATHPIDPVERNSGTEYGKPITIGDNVWIGGNCVVMQGVTIGDGTVIGAGSVVTRDIPAGVIAFGNPCRVIRPVTEDDRITEVV